MFKDFNKKVEIGVFYPAFALIAFIILWGAIHYSSLSAGSKWLMNFIRMDLGAWINFCTTSCVAVLAYLMFSKRGDIRIGGKDAKSPISFFSWFTMSLCSSIGVGIIFWGIAEPLMHFTNPPAFLGVTGSSPAAGAAAMGSVYIDWGFHPNSFIAVVGIAVAVAAHNYNLPVRISSIFHPMIGDRIYKKLGMGIDSFAIAFYIIATGTMISYASMQMAAGIEYMTGIQATRTVSLIIIAVLGVYYTLSSVSGIKKAVSFNANLNFGIYVVLLAFVLLVGRTVFIVNLTMDGIANYASRFLAGGIFMDAFNVSDGWVQGWPVFMFAWFAATTFITSNFYAQISVGRTIREMVFVNAVLPGIFAIVWFGIFGSAAIDMEYSGAGLMQIINNRGIDVAAYEFFKRMPLASIMIPLFFIGGVMSFVTGVNSCVTAVSVMSQNRVEQGEGDMREPAKIIKIIWGASFAVIGAIVLCLGDVKDIQTAAITSGLPSSILIFLALICLIIATNPSYMAKYSTVYGEKCQKD